MLRLLDSDMVQLVELIPDPDVVVALEPEELGLRMLLVLATWPRFVNLSLEAFLQNLIGNPQAPSSVGQYPQNRRNEIVVAASEAWAWLENATLLINPPPVGPAFQSTRVLSRRAQQLAKEPETRRAFSTRRIPKDALHPAIRQDVWADYHRGKYDTAVFEAMKAVEVAVRDVSGFAPRDIGTALMRKAFDPETGPLTDLADEKSEREARSALFAGAIGSYKSPHSHRKVALDDPDEAAEIIMLANHLLRIVDERRMAKAGP
jgi:uncharacterized protein (TIGR02391 family)